MPMDKTRYPENWKDIAMNVKVASGWKCMECGMQCRKPGEPFDTHKRTLTVHHINHIPEDCRGDNLIALCASCHLKADAKYHAENRAKRRKRDEAGRSNHSIMSKTLSVNRSRKGG